MSEGNFLYFEDFVVGEVIDLGEFPPLERQGTADHAPMIVKVGE